MGPFGHMLGNMESGEFSLRTRSPQFSPPFATAGLLAWRSRLLSKDAASALVHGAGGKLEPVADELTAAALPRGRCPTRTRPWEVPSPKVPPLTLDRLRVGPLDQRLKATIVRQAAQHHVEERALRLQALLHLPRIADGTGHVASHAAKEETASLAKGILATTGEFASWAVPPTCVPAAPSELHVQVADESIARPILERFHYLRSFRQSSLHVVGAASDGSPAALMSFSAFDLTALERALPSDVASAEALVLSRVFAFNWLPRNGITYLMRRALAIVRERHPAARFVFTYVNPNLGFSAASYRAANWRLIAQEYGTRYAYLDGDYVTDRHLLAVFGTTDAARLRDRLGERFVVSHMPLAPLDLYGLALDRRLDRSMGERPPVAVQRALV